MPIKMCSNETYCRLHAGKYLHDAFPIHSGLKEKDAFSPLFFNYTLTSAIRKVQENNKWDKSAMLC
jgi:hypothetical protein